MAKTVNISSFKGMITDIEDTHLPPNAFVELFNWRRTKDNILEKIPGYKKHTDYLFAYAVNSITQLKRPEDDNIFILILIIYTERTLMGMFLY